MFYRPENEPHGLPFNPFKALVVPRPIGWVSTLSPRGVLNLAPYSYFNAVSSDPPILMFASGGAETVKDSPQNAEQTGEFVINIVPESRFEAMVKTSATVAEDVDEAELAGLCMSPCNVVKVPRVASSPISFECRFLNTVELPAGRDGRRNLVTMGRVVGIHIDDGVIQDGKVDIRRVRPLARLGYDEYAVISEPTTLAAHMRQQQKP